MRLLLLVLLIPAILAPVARCAPGDPPPVLPEEGRGVPIMGRVIWPDHDLTKTVVRVYADPERKSLVDTFPTGGPKGGIVFALDPGTYYLMAFSDQDGDGRATPGDGLGFYGVTGPDSELQPLIVDEGAGVITLNLPIAFKIAEDRRSLEPVAVKSAQPYVPGQETALSGTVTGALEGEAAPVILLVPLAAHFPPRAAVATAEGKFALTAVPGAYQLLALQDINASGTFDCGDLVAVAGYDFEMGATIPALHIAADKPLEGQALDLKWALDREGRLRTGDGELLGPRLNLAGLPTVCSGSVTRLGQPAAKCTVRAYADATLKDLMALTTANEQGQFCLGLDPASYVIVAHRDVDGDAATGPGDELGFQGVTGEDPAATPQALLLRPGDLKLGLSIALTLLVGADGKPVALKE